jgi:hypothetical protein
LSPFGIGERKPAGRSRLCRKSLTNAEKVVEL